MKTSYIKLFIGIAAVLFTSTAWSQSTPAGGSCDSGDCLTTFAWTEDSNDPKMASGLAQDATCGVALNASVTYTGNDTDPLFDNVSFNADNQISGSGTQWTDEWEVSFNTSLTNPVLDFNNLFTDTQISITDCSGNAISLTQLSDNSTIASGTFSGNNEVQLSGTHSCIKVTLSNDKKDGYEVKVNTCLSASAPPTSNITAIGTCSGITAANENKYNISVSGLDASTTYNIDFDGDGTADDTNITGVALHISSTAIAFSTGPNAGSATQTVQIDAGADGSYETTIIVHEVLCTDADDDGALDFESGCDVSTNMADQGYIVATIAPYNGNNVYAYVLTDANDKAQEANFSGLFTGLASGGNGNTDDYNVVAFNLADLAEAQSYIATLTFGTSGTLVTASSSSTGCSMACGSMAYNIECCLEPVATVSVPETCTLTADLTLTASVTTGTVNNYSIDFDDAAITDIGSTAYPANNEIGITLPTTLAAGDYTGTITFIDYVGCSGTDDFTITVKPRPTVTATAPAAICVGDAVPNYTLSGTPNATVNYRVNDDAASITLDGSGNAMIPASNTESTALVIASVFINGCSTTNIPSVSATVNPLPTASVAGTTTICTNDAAPIFTFSGTPNAVVTYKIDGGASTDITLNASGTALLTASNTASSTVTLESVELTSTGCTQNVTGSATVTVKPRPMVTPTPPAAICVGDAVPNYTLSGTPNATVNYRVNDNAASITLDGSGNATIAASNTESTALVIASVFIDGCSTTNIPSVSATVNPLPTASVAGGTSICSGDTAPEYTFSGTPNAVITYSLTNGSNTTITLDATGEAKLTASNTESSTVNLVSVSLTATSCTQNVSGSATVTVNDPIVVEAGSGPDVCSTGTIDLTALNATISGGHTGTWTSNGSGSFNNGGVLGSATTYTPSPADIAMGSVVLTLTSADPTGPCDASFDMVTITILNVACGSFPWDGSND